MKIYEICFEIDVIDGEQILARQFFSKFPTLQTVKEKMLAPFLKAKRYTYEAEMKKKIEEGLTDERVQEIKWKDNREDYQNVIVSFGSRIHIHSHVLH